MSVNKEKHAKHFSQRKQSDFKMCIMLIDFRLCSSPCWVDTTCTFSFQNVLFCPRAFYTRYVSNYMVISTKLFFWSSFYNLNDFFFSFRFSSCKIVSLAIRKIHGHLSIEQASNYNRAQNYSNSCSSWTCW